MQSADNKAFLLVSREEDEPDRGRKAVAPGIGANGFNLAAFRAAKGSRAESSSEPVSAQVDHSKALNSRS